jgi:hypothetical protein
MTLTQNNAGDDLETRKVLWLRRNRGILTRLSQEFDLSYSMIASCFWGKTASGERRVERRFAELGAPGFTPEEVRAE